MAVKHRLRDVGIIREKKIENEIPQTALDVGLKEKNIYNRLEVNTSFAFIFLAR